MAPSAVRFHPAAAQEVESTYEWYAATDVSAAHGFREEVRQAVDAVVARPQTWPRYGSRTRRYVAHDGTCFPAIPSASYTSCTAMALRSSPWRTAGGDPDTGGRDSETPSNKPLERPGTNAWRPAERASAGRSAPSR